MAWKPDYTTLALLKAHLRIADTADDTALSACISAASRAIDYETDRQFGSASQVRYYTWDGYTHIDGRPAVKVDDVSTTVALVVSYDTNLDGGFDDTATIETDFVLWPYNASAESRPWTHLLLSPYNPILFPVANSRGLKVSATFGWASVPAVVAQAALIQASRFFVRRDSAFGVAGSPDLGNELRLQERVDPDVAVLLKSVKRRWGAA